MIRASSRRCDCCFFCLPLLLDVEEFERTETMICLCGKSSSSVAARGDAYPKLDVDADLSICLLLSGRDICAVAAAAGAALAVVVGLFFMWLWLLLCEEAVLLCTGGVSFLLYPTDEIWIICFFFLILILIERRTRSHTHTEIHKTHAKCLRYYTCMQFMNANPANDRAIDSSSETNQTSTLV